LGWLTVAGSTRGIYIAVIRGGREEGAGSRTPWGGKPRIFTSGKRLEGESEPQIYELSGPNCKKGFKGMASWNIATNVHAGKVKSGKTGLLENPATSQVIVMGVSGLGKKKGRFKREKLRSVRVVPKLKKLLFRE